MVPEGAEMKEIMLELGTNELQWLTSRTKNQSIVYYFLMFSFFSNFTYVPVAPS